MQQDSSATHKRDIGEIKQSFERLNQQQHEMANLLQVMVDVAYLPFPC